MRFVIVVGLVDTVDKTPKPADMGLFVRYTLDMRLIPFDGTFPACGKILENSSTAFPQKSRVFGCFYILTNRKNTPHIWG